VHQGFAYRLKDVSNESKNTSYAPVSDDIVISTKFEVSAPDGHLFELNPLYVIRGDRPFVIKDEAFAEGVHIKMSNIDPQQGLMEFLVANSAPSSLSLPIDVADDIPSSDYIVMEAIVFPGINLVWAGSLLMLLGLAIGVFLRKKSAK
jgi:cytochrome c-type biogenesis protein CcmF